MADREKVIKDCRWAINQIIVNGHTTITTRGFFRDVISLLNEKNAKPETSNVTDYISEYSCGECQKPVFRGDNYCRGCGIKLKWKE